MPRPETRSDLRVEQLSTLSQFQAVSGVWDQLCARATDSFPMLTHAWLCAWWKAFGDELAMRVLLVWRGDVLVGAAPLVLRCEPAFGSRRRVLALFTNSWVDRSHLLLAEISCEVIDAMLEHARTCIPYDVMDLFPLEDASPQTAALLERLRVHHHVGIEEHLNSPFLRVPASWEQLQQDLSSSFRQSVRRKVRKVGAMPNVSMSVVRDASCFAAIEAVSLESWQHDEGTSMVSTPQVREFYTAIVQAAASSGTLRCAVMNVDGEPAAFEFNLMHGDTLHNFKLGFRKKYADLSTGIVLKAYLLECAMTAAEKPTLREYDFMGTSEAYKLNWTKTVRTHSRLRVFRRRWNLTPIYWLSFVVKPWTASRFPKITEMLRKLKNRFR
jgi:CelD/BcsL family acetyltransferase involved in cellulose biosynthesis